MNLIDGVYYWLNFKNSRTKQIGQALRKRFDLNEFNIIKEIEMP